MAFDKSLKLDNKMRKWTSAGPTVPFLLNRQRVGGLYNSTATFNIHRRLSAQIISKFCDKSENQSSRQVPHFPRTVSL